MLASARSYAQNYRMMHRSHYLPFLLASFSAISGLTVGFNNPDLIIEVQENIGFRNKRLCVAVFDGQLNQDLMLGLIYSDQTARR